LGIKILVVNLLVKATASFLGGAHVAISGSEAALEQPGAVFGAQASLLVEGLSDEDEVSRADLADSLLINEIQSRLIDQPNVQTLLPHPKHSIPSTMKHITESDDISSRTIDDDVVFTRLELVVLAEDASLTVFLEDIGKFGAGGEDEADAFIPEDTLDDGVHLGCIGGEVEPGRCVHETVITKHVVNTEMAGIISDLIDTAMREVAKEVAVIQPGHGDLGDTHLKESGKGGEDTLLLFVETETGSCGEVATLHDTGGDEHLGVLLVDDLETGRALEITVDTITLLAASSFEIWSRTLQTLVPN